MTTTLLRLILPWRSPTTSATSRTFFLRFAHESNICRGFSMTRTNSAMIMSPYWHHVYLRAYRLISIQYLLIIQHFHISAFWFAFSSFNFLFIETIDIISFVQFFAVSSSSGTSAMAWVRSFSLSNSNICFSSFAGVQSRPTITVMKDTCILVTPCQTFEAVDEYVAHNLPALRLRFHYSDTKVVERVLGK